MDDGDMTAQALYNFEHVLRKKDRSAARDHTLQHRFQSSGSDGIDAFERLIEKKYLRSMNYGRRHRQLLLHAVRIVCDQLLRLIGKLHEVEQFRAALRRGFAVESVHAPRKIKE